MKIAVRDMPTADQPRYRAKVAGASALSVAELLQVICRNHHLDSNYELVQKAGGLTGLARMSIEEISEIDGLGESAALSIEAALELGRRLAIEENQDKLKLRSPADVAHLLMPQYGHEEQEHFIVVMLDTRNQVIDVEVVYKGSTNAAHIRSGEVFRSAVRKNAVGIIIAHNHPSQDPSPSPQDVHITRLLVEAGELLDIEVLDHLVFCRSRYVSLRERGLGFS